MNKLNQNHPSRDEVKINGRVAICRCWQSNKFPYCDGSHNQYNQDNADALGPLIVEIDHEA